jgi:hypothetical protein
MRWVVFSLWLLLTPIWISYSSSAGSGPKVAFIPPALVLIALVLDWLWRRLVLRFAGEFEPLGRGNVQQVQQPATRGAPRLSLKGTFHPVWGLTLPSSKILRLSLVAAAVGVCAGAVVGQSTFDTAVSNKSGTPPNPPNLPISVQTEPVRSQSFLAEPKTAALIEQSSTVRVRIQEVKSQFSEGLENRETVSGAVPDPSAGMSGPPPAPQQQAVPQSRPLVSPQLLTGKPLGPATPLQMKNEPKPAQTSTSTAAQPENQTTHHMQTEPKPVQTSTPRQPQNQTTQQMQNEPQRVQTSTVPEPQNSTAQTPMLTGRVTRLTGRVTRPPERQTSWPSALSRAQQATVNQTPTKQTTTSQTPTNQTTGNEASATETATKPQQPSESPIAHAIGGTNAATGDAGLKEANGRERPKIEKSRRAGSAGPSLPMRRIAAATMRDDLSQSTLSRHAVTEEAISRFSQARI